MFVCTELEGGPYWLIIDIKSRPTHNDPVLISNTSLKIWFFQWLFVDDDQLLATPANVTAAVRRWRLRRGPFTAAAVQRDRQADIATDREADRRWCYCPPCSYPLRREAAVSPGWLTENHSGPAVTPSGRLTVKSASPVSSGAGKMSAAGADCQLTAARPRPVQNNHPPSQTPPATLNCILTSHRCLFERA